jgi:hypothetical protein
VLTFFLSCLPSVPLPSSYRLQEILNSPSTQDIVIASRLFENYNRNVAYTIDRINTTAAAATTSKAGAGEEGKAAAAGARDRTA